MPKTIEVADNASVLIFTPADDNDEYFTVGLDPYVNEDGTIPRSAFIPLLITTMIQDGDEGFMELCRDKTEQYLAEMNRKGIKH